MMGTREIALVFVAIGAAVLIVAILIILVSEVAQ